MRILKKIINIIFNILIFIVLIFIILGLYYIIQMKVLKKDNASIFGYAFFEVATGSMSGTIEIGDVIIVKNTKDVHENDIIVYKENEDYITHRLIKINEDNCITRGDANNSEDKPIKKEQIYGTVEKIIPKVGIWEKVLLSKEVVSLGIVLIIIIGILVWLKEKRRRRMIKSKKKILYLKLIILLLGLIVLVRMFTIVLSRYESEADSMANVDIAFYVFKEDFTQMSLNLASMFPQNNEFEYTFSVGNQDGIKTAQTDIEYDLTLRTTTNLPLTYELQMNNNGNFENIIQNNNIIQDDFNTYFRVITTSKQQLYYRTPKTNVYKLIIHFPQNYNTTDYQDIIEMLEIKIDAKQVI